jgi:hypothetical protein
MVPLRSYHFSALLIVREHFNYTLIRRVGRRFRNAIDIRVFYFKELSDKRRKKKKEKQRADKYIGVGIAITSPSGVQTFTR